MGAKSKPRSLHNFHGGGTIEHSTVTFCLYSVILFYYLLGVTVHVSHYCCRASELTLSFMDKLIILTYLLTYPSVFVIWN